MLAQNLDAISGYAGLNTTSRANLATIIERFLPYAFYGAGILLLVYFILGGFQLMFSQGDPKAAQAAQGKITNALVGFIIVIFAYFIVSVLGKIFGISVFSEIFSSGGGRGR